MMVKRRLLMAAFPGISPMRLLDFARVRRAAIMTANQLAARLLE
jgi:hypothetical protein